MHGCVFVCVCFVLFDLIAFHFLSIHFDLHVKALLKHWCKQFLWFNYNVLPVGVVDVATIYLVIISDTTNEL